MWQAYQPEFILLLSNRSINWQMQSSLSNDIIPEYFKRKGIRVADAFLLLEFSHVHSLRYCFPITLVNNCVCNVLHQILFEFDQLLNLISHVHKIHCYSIRAACCRGFQITSFSLNIISHYIVTIVCAGAAIFMAPIAIYR